MAKTDKSEDILCAALELIAEQGFHAAPMAMIAERDGGKRDGGKRGSPGFGVSSALSKCASIDRGISIWYFLNTARASAKVVGSGVVGPDAITARSSPTTSEIASVWTVAGAHASANRPPLMAERCLRTVLIS